MKIKNIIQILFFLISTLTISQVNFQTNLSKNSLGINERLRVEFTVNEDGDNFEPPSFENFKIVGGPSQSIKNSWVNGVKSYSKSYTYFLSPTNIGVYKIGQAKIEVEGKTYKTSSVEIKVTDAVKNPNKENDPNYISDNDIYLVSEISNQNPFLNEKVSIIYKLYFSSNIAIENSREVSSPRYTDFWSQNIDIKNLVVENGTFKGQPYRFVILKKSVVYPQKDGKLIIEPLTLDLTLQLPTNRRDFFGQRIMKSTQKIVSSGQKNITVKALPLINKPTNFSGAVGQFDLNINSSKKELAVSEALELEVEIKGNGNLKLFQLPKFNLSSSLEIFEPEKQENITTLISGMKGSVKDLYTIIPQKPGRYTIPKISFVYFDLSSKTYKELSSSPIFIEVEGLEPKVQSNLSNTNKKIKINQIDIDLLPFKTKTNLIKLDNTYLFNTSLYWIYFTLPIILCVLIILSFRLFKHKPMFISNQNRDTKRLAKKYLKEAKNNLNNKDVFYESLDKALHNYLKTVIVIENSDLSKSKIVKQLKSIGVEKKTYESLNDLFNNCEIARYTPITNVEMELDYKKANQIISLIETQIK